MDRKRKIKMGIFAFCTIALIGYIVFMCIESEPKYKNNAYGKPEIGDYVVVNLGTYDGYGSGLVVQTDSLGFTANIHTGFMSTHHDELIPVGYAAPIWRIIGTGTFYHRVNEYVGFNIMAITIWINIVLAIIVIRGLSLILYDLLD